MLRVVPDTNILISALMFGGLSAAFLDLGFLQSFQLVTSSFLLDELDDKLRLKFKVSPAKTIAFWNARLPAKQTTSSAGTDTC